MRENRLSFWITSLIICACIIFIYSKIQKLESRVLPYEERQTTYIYSPKELQKNLKGTFEMTSVWDDYYGNTHKITFTDDKNNASLILTDRVTSKDVGYEKVGWTPLIVAFDENKKKVKTYVEDGYLIEVDEDTYEIDFKKIISDVESGSWKDKIYYPKKDTREGELFYDFLLSNANDGKYPDSDKEMKEAKETIDSFLSSSCLVESDTVDRLKTVYEIKDSLYIIFEKDIYEMDSSNYKYKISYPTETVVKEWYCCYKGAKGEEIKTQINISSLMSNNRIRTIGSEGAYSATVNSRYNIKYNVKDGYSYVPIPLKEE